MAVNPYLTIKGAARQLGVALTTARRAIQRLEKLGVVMEVSGGQRDRVSCAKTILSILEEPAQLKPTDRTSS